MIHISPTLFPLFHVFPSEDYINCYRIICSIKQWNGKDTIYSHRHNNQILQIHFSLPSFAVIKWNLECILWFVNFLIFFLGFVFIFLLVIYFHKILTRFTSPRFLKKNLIYTSLFFFYSFCFIATNSNFLSVSFWMYVLPLEYIQITSVYSLIKLTSPLSVTFNF